MRAKYARTIREPGIRASVGADCLENQEQLRVELAQHSALKYLALSLYCEC